MVQSESFADRLKTETRPQHDAAERHELQRALLKGALPQARFVALVGQLMLVHRALASAIRGALESDPILAAMWREAYDQSPRMARDLAHFGVDPDGVTPTPATTAFIDRIGQWAGAAPASLLGPLYVLEGSTNGARYIARAARQAYPVGADDAGVTHLDPYGERQPEEWADFRARLNALDLDEATQRAIVDAARETFNAIGAIGDDVLTARAGSTLFD